MGPYQCNRWPFVSGFFYLLNCFSSHIPVAISISILVFCWWIILHCMDISHLLVHSSVDGYLGIPPSFQLLRIIRLWTLMCKFSCEIFFNSPRRGMTGQKKTAHFTFWRTAKLLSKGNLPLCILTCKICAFQFLHVFTNSCYFLWLWL